MQNILRLLPVSLLLASCATSSGIPSAQTGRRTVTVQTSPSPGGQQLELTREANINSVGLEAELAEAWAALPPVFEALDLPITGLDKNAHLLSTVQRVRRIGGKSPSSYFNCPGPYGNLASSGDVYLSLRAQILPGEGGSGSLLRTQVDASARPSTGGSQVECRSNGLLQKLISDTLIGRLANG